MKPSDRRRSGRPDSSSHRFSTSRLVAVLLLAGGVLLAAGLVAGPVAGVAVPGDDTTDQQVTPVQVGGSAGGSASGSGGGGASVQTQDAREIAYGDTVRSSIDEDDPEADAYRGYHEPLTFEGDAGDVVAVRMAAGFRGERGYYEPRPPRRGGEGRPADPYLFVVGPDGDVLAENDDTENGLNAAVSGIVLPENGEYTVVAAGYGETETFDYTLELRSLDREAEDLRQIEVNSTTTGAIDKTDPYDPERRGFYEPVTFEGESGQTVRVEMGSRPGDTYLQLLDPSGDVIAENDDSDGLNSTIDRVTLTEDGEYTVVATSFSREETFPYELSVEVVASGGDAGPDLRTIEPGQTRESRIDESDPRAPFLRGYFEPVTFDGEEGQDVTVEMTSDDDSYLVLYGPRGDVVAENDDADGLDSRIETTLPDDGEYTIIATSFDQRATFDYTLSLTVGENENLDADLRSIEYGETREGAIGEDDPRSEIYRGYYEPVTFDGSAGDTVTVGMSSEDDTYLVLLAPNGTVLAENDDFRGLDSQIRTTLPEDGEYTVVATSFDPDATFAYELTVQESGGVSA